MEVRVLSTAPFPRIENLPGKLPRAWGAFVLIANFGQPFFQNGLILLFDLSEHHAHAVLAHIHNVAERRENCAAVQHAEPYPGAGRERFLRAHLAAKHAEIGGLFAGFGFRFHFDQVNAGRKRIPTGSRSLDQELSPNSAPRKGDIFMMS